jgi:hypothetical protein
VSTNRPTVRRGRRRDDSSPLAGMAIRAEAPVTASLQDGGAQDSAQAVACRVMAQTGTDCFALRAAGSDSGSREPHEIISHAFGAGASERFLDRDSARAGQSCLRPSDRGGGWPITTPLRMVGADARPYPTGRVGRVAWANVWAQHAQSLGAAERELERPSHRRERRKPADRSRRSATKASATVPRGRGQTTPHSRLGRATAKRASSVGPARRARASGQLAVS